VPARPMPMHPQVRTHGGLEPPKTLPAQAPPSFSDQTLIDGRPPEAFLGSRVPPRRR